LVDFFHAHGVLVRAEWLASGAGQMKLHDPALAKLETQPAASRIPIIGADSQAILQPTVGRRGEMRAAVTECLKTSQALVVFVDVSPSSFARVVTGDAMSPALVADDLVVIDPEAKVLSGCAVLVQFEETWILRRFQDDGARWLCADNSRYPNIQLTASAQVIGRVVQLLRSKV